MCADFDHSGRQITFAARSWGDELCAEASDAGRQIRFGTHTMRGNELVCPEFSDADRQVRSAVRPYSYEAVCFDRQAPDAGLSSVQCPSIENTQFDIGSRIEAEMRNEAAINAARTLTEMKNNLYRAVDSEISIRPHGLTPVTYRQSHTQSIVDPEASTRRFGSGGSREVTVTRDGQGRHDVHVSDAGGTWSWNSIEQLDTAVTEMMRGPHSPEHRIPIESDLAEFRPSNQPNGQAADDRSVSIPMSSAEHSPYTPRSIASFTADVVGPRGEVRQLGRPVRRSAPLPGVSENRAHPAVANPPTTTPVAGTHVYQRQSDVNLVPQADDDIYRHPRVLELIADIRGANSRASPDVDNRHAVGSVTDGVRVDRFSNVAENQQIGPSTRDVYSPVAYPASASVQQGRLSGVVADEVRSLSAVNELVAAMHPSVVRETGPKCVSESPTDGPTVADAGDGVQRSSVRLTAGQSSHRQRKHENRSNKGRQGEGDGNEPSDNSGDSDSGQSSRRSRDRHRRSDNHGRRRKGSPPSSDSSSRSRGDRRSDKDRRQNRNSGDPPSDEDRDKGRKRKENRPPSGSPTPERYRSRFENRKHWIKPKEFDGQSSFESFMVTFNDVAKFNKWNAREKLAYLRTSLTGAATQLLWGADDVTFDQLVEKLKNRFGAIGMEERYQAELRCRRRRHGEPIRELAQDIRRLMSLAYPDQGDSILWQHIAREAFLSALDDPELQIDVRKGEPRTFEETVRLASRYEITKAAVETSSSASRHRMSRKVDGVQEEMPPVEACTLAHQCREPSDSSHVTAEPDGKNQCEVPKPSRRSPRRKERRSRATDRAVAPVSQPEASPTYVEASQLDEIMKKLREMDARNRHAEAEMSARLDSMTERVERNECLMQAKAQNTVRPIPVQRQEQRQSPVGQGESGKQTVVCWNCQGQGHMARQCPVYRRTGPPSSSNPPLPPNPQRQPQEQRRQEFRTSGIAKTSAKSTSCSADSSATYLRARIDGREQDCLLDTGSEISILPSSLVPREQLKPVSYTLRAVNGTKIEVLGQATVSLVTPWCRSTVTGLVTEHVAEVILGVEWLQQNRAEWKFGEDSICLNGHKHKLASRPKGQKWCRRVVVQEDTEVPPMSQQNLSCKVVFHGNPCKYVDQYWETETSVSQDGLLVARTLTPLDRYADVPIRVMNLEDEAKQIKAGTVLTDLEPVEVLGTVDSSSMPSSSDRSSDLPEHLQELIDKEDPETPPKLLRG